MKNSTSKLTIDLIIVVILSLFASICLHGSNQNYTLITDKNHKIKPASNNDYELDFSVIWNRRDLDYPRSIDVDSSGNIYVTGIFNASVNNDDIFVVKFDDVGNTLLNISWGTVNDDHACSIVVDDLKNIFVTGYRYVGGSDYIAFIAKFDSTGHSTMNITWDRGTGRDFGNDIILDDMGNIYITGTSDGLVDSYAFVAKFNSTGHSEMNITWGVKASGDTIDLDESENIFVGGLTYLNNPLGNAFVSKFNSTGHSEMNITWGCDHYVDNAHAELDNVGNIYITGTNNPSGQEKVYITKFDSIGNNLYNISWGGSEADHANAIAIDDAGFIYITGYVFDYDLGYSAAYIAKYDSSGNSLINISWGRGEGDDIHIDNAGAVYITGQTFNDESFMAKYILIPEVGDDDDDNDDDDDGNNSTISFGINTILISILSIVCLIILRKREKQF